MLAVALVHDRVFYTSLVPLDHEQLQFMLDFWKTTLQYLLTYIIIYMVCLVCYHHFLIFLLFSFWSFMIICPLVSTKHCFWICNLQHLTLMWRISINLVLCQGNTFFTAEIIYRYCQCSQFNSWTFRELFSKCSSIFHGNCITNFILSNLFNQLSLILL